MGYVVDRFDSLDTQRRLLPTRLSFGDTITELDDIFADDDDECVYNMPSASEWKSERKARRTKLGYVDHFEEFDFLSGDDEVYDVPYDEFNDEARAFAQNRIKVLKKEKASQPTSGNGFADCMNLYRFSDDGLHGFDRMRTRKLKSASNKEKTLRQRLLEDESYREPMYDSERTIHHWDNQKHYQYDMMRRGSRRIVKDIFDSIIDDVGRNGWQRINRNNEIDAIAADTVDTCDSNKNTEVSIKKLNRRFKKNESRV